MAFFEEARRAFITFLLGLETYVALAMHVLLWTLPVLIVGTFFVNSWVLMEVLYFRIILSRAPSAFFFAWTPKEVLLAYGLLGVYVFLLLNAAGSIGLCWYYSCFDAKGYRMPSGSVAPRPRTVMQTTFGTSRRFDFELLGSDGNRPNRCGEQCVNAGAWRGDRMYHCRHGYNCCLPVFDHYCFWLWVPVYLKTIKPYCLFMPYMFLYSVFSGAVVSWALASPHIRGLSRWSYAVLALSTIFGIISATKMMKFQWTAIVLHNRVGKERGANWRWSMAVLNIKGRLMFDEPSFNPYSLGSRWANAQEVLGPWYQMPFWFWQPARVGQYGDHWNLDCDTTISPAYMVHANLMRLREMPGPALDMPPPPVPPAPPPRGFFRRRHNASSSMV
ncbi:DHHC zinc finger domain-containing protein [Colletotrichum graminicola]|uniref:Palmitoyltransferase n=1 Tax=Colletotrichum graminicola (strain M1.001 / M2 / FGSC 10212) TaxID=645133 RepID=E3Q9G4_COLGM|nr:DHHC zinc finger domain-containing protein [Colletotrichum graminicola M1.001]EFQ27343.1 DHHC zinc finger domain-containing protein [Colletotrichum graminicola M1.001]WDK13132.1 DHHC zinc finger domain-containing protein [Colletotrichum graminicola]